MTQWYGTNMGTSGTQGIKSWLHQTDIWIYEEFFSIFNFFPYLTYTLIRLSCLLNVRCSPPESNSMAMVIAWECSHSFFTKKTTLWQSLFRKYLKNASITAIPFHAGVHFNEEIRCIEGEDFWCPRSVEKRCSKKASTFTKQGFFINGIRKKASNIFLGINKLFLIWRVFFLQYSTWLLRHFAAWVFGSTTWRAYHTQDQPDGIAIVTGFFRMIIGTIKPAVVQNPSHFLGMSATDDAKGKILKFMKDNKMDPLMIFGMLLAASCTKSETTTYPDFLKALINAVSDARSTVDDVLDIFKDMFDGTRNEGRLGITKMRHAGKTMNWIHSRYSIPKLSNSQVGARKTLGKCNKIYTQSNLPEKFIPTGRRIWLRFLQGRWVAISIVRAWCRSST